MKQKINFNSLKNIEINYKDKKTFFIQDFYSKMVLKGWDQERQENFSSQDFLDLGKEMMNDKIYLIKKEFKILSTKNQNDKDLILEMERIESMLSLMDINNFSIEKIINIYWDLEIFLKNIIQIQKEELFFSENKKDNKKSILLKTNFLKWKWKIFTFFQEHNLFSNTLN